MHIDRRSFLTGAGKFAFATALVSPGAALQLASHPVRASQSTGAHSWSVGDIRITALLDGFVELDATIFADADPSERRTLLEEAGQKPGKFAVDVNAFLLEHSGKLTLIDSGTRDLFGPTLGKVPAALRNIGVDPANIGHVLLTHMHNDHVGGLLDENGAAAFPNAELVVPAAEWDYWTSEDVYSAASDQGRYSFAGARAAAPVYKDRVKTFAGEAEILPGVFPIALPGHSIGHTGFRLASGSEQMIVWGDIVVSPQVQFAHPEWASTFDADGQLSIASRIRMFDEAAADRILVAGMHLPFPGGGRVEVHGLSYRFLPFE
ncbi:MBL fold metallo-hydrolase [Oricola thermophila]|uniref:MBL fold metallo-hydrolase n=1 Tax=Oricola thermophila TaxID=2742145 RepID=A0A6N1V967_9HYPH|nr:MBL fold metallo-hydrolase [Oricola thermophila]QKV17514.1 MBL fold metallo-hydrolase [Oricola thermophila]